MGVSCSSECLLYPLVKGGRLAEGQRGDLSCINKTPRRENPPARCARPPPLTRGLKHATCLSHYSASLIPVSATIFLQRAASSARYLPRKSGVLPIMMVPSLESLLTTSGCLTIFASSALSLSR